MGLNAHKLVREEVERVLVSNLNLSVWSPTDMPDIDPDFMRHKLALLPRVKPVSQRGNSEKNEGDSGDRGIPACQSRIHQGSHVHHVARKCGNGKEVKW